MQTFLPCREHAHTQVALREVSNQRGPISHTMCCLHLGFLRGDETCLGEWSEGRRGPLLSGASHGGTGVAARLFICARRGLCVRWFVIFSRRCVDCLWSLRLLSRYRRKGLWQHMVVEKGGDSWPVAMGMLVAPEVIPRYERVSLV
jgi:hypothetical protein